MIGFTLVILAWIVGFGIPFLHAIYQARPAFFDRVLAVTGGILLVSLFLILF